MAIFAPLIAKARRPRAERPLPARDDRLVRPAAGPEQGLLDGRRPGRPRRLRPRGLRRADVAHRRHRRHRASPSSSGRSSASSPATSAGSSTPFISRTIDVILAIPILLFAIGIVAVCSVDRPGLPPRADQAGAHARHLRDRALHLAVHRAHRARQHAVAAREGVRRGGAARSAPGTSGSCSRRSCRTSLAPIIVYSTLLIPSNILFEAGLSFLGLGVPQRTPSWGGMLSDAIVIFEVAWWLMLFPGPLPRHHHPGLQPPRRRTAGRARPPEQPLITL